MYASWLSFISGIASVLFTAFGIFSNWSANGQATFWFVMAVVGVLFASAGVWYKDRPQTYIELLEIIATRQEDGIYIKFELSGVNTKKETNAINRQQLVLDTGIAGKSRGVGLAVDSNPKLYEKMSVHRPILEQGIEQVFWLTFMFNDGVPVLDKEFILTLTDSYKETYIIKGRTPIVLS
ncbi:hypothetical protein BH10ACI1_BH10ACI1_13210 [soil metagenome]